MLGNKNAVANVAVKDLETAKKFYEEILGLTEVDSEGDEVIVLKSGDTTLNLYRSQFAGTNKATAVTWMVDDVDELVEELKGKGVTFEHYDIEGVRQEGDVYVGDDMRVAWFKDPDGNILNIVSD